MLHLIRNTFRRASRADWDYMAKDLHHAHVVLTTGDRIRLTQATAGQGVTPLTH